MKPPRLAALVAAALLVFSAPAGALLPDAASDTHVRWVHAGDGNLSAVATAQVDGQGAPDIIAVGGHRTGYIRCIVPPSNPMSFVNQVLDTAVVGPVPQLVALKGETGAQLWKVTLGAGGVGGYTANAPDRWELVEGVVAGDLDGDGSEDLLVLRTSIKAGDNSDVVQHTTMYDPRDGSVRWTQAERPGEGLGLRALMPTSLFGEPGAILLRVSVGPDFAIASQMELVRFTGTGLGMLAEMPAIEGITIPVTMDHGDAMRMFLMVNRIILTPPQPSIESDIVALDVSKGPDGISFAEAWKRPGLGGFPAVVTDGPDPALVFANYAVTAIDAGDGSNRWSKPIDVSPEGGTFVAADVNRDGSDDIVASPAFGTADPVGLTAELVALEGGTGAELWRRVEPGGKFRAFSMRLGALGAARTPVVVASMVHQDGFAACAVPADDPGLISVFDLQTGAQRCRLSTDRFAPDVLPVDVGGVFGDEFVAPTYGGRVYAFQNAQPGCGALGTNPLAPS